MSPRPCPTANTGSRRCRAYAKSATPPRRLRYQNVRGMMTRRARSDTIHCTKKREPNVTWPRKPIAYHRATDEKRLSLIRHPPNLVAKHPRLEPADSQEIADSPEEAVPHPVFRDAVPARPVEHRDFRHARAPELTEGRKEAMGPHEERQPIQCLAPVRFQRAAHVGDGIPDGGAAHRVRDPRRGAPAPGIGARRAHAR